MEAFKYKDKAQVIVPTFTAMRHEDVLEVMARPWPVYLRPPAPTTSKAKYTGPERRQRLQDAGTFNENRRIDNDL